MTDQRPLRILLYRPPWRHGELYFRAQQVVTHFQKRGHQVTAVAGPGDWRSLVRLLSWPWHLARADLVFLSPQPLLPLFALTAKWLGRRVVIDHYVSYVRLADPASGPRHRPVGLERAAYRRADCVLVHTESMAEALRTVHALPDDRVHTVYSVVDTAHFSPLYDDEVSRLRRELGLADRFIVLYHGLWHPWHGLETLRAAVARLAERGEPVALVLIGRAGQGAAHERLLGEVAYEDLPPYIQMADVWCSGFVNLPRGDRSFSSTMIQALALARPVLTSPSSEKTRLLRAGETAFFVPPDDPEALAEAIRHCRLHPDVARRVGQAGRRLAQQTFDIAVFNDLLAHLTRTWFGQ